MIPTTAEEYRRWEKAVALLKSVQPPVLATVIKTPVRMDPKTTVPRKNPQGNELDETNYVEGSMGLIDAEPKPLRDKRGNVIRAAYLSIAGDDLAKTAPGALSRNYSVGDKVWLTEEAAERLAAQGWVSIDAAG